MNTRPPLIASTLLAASLISGAAHAALQGRDLNGSIESFEAYYDTVLDITWLADANYGAGSSYDDSNRMGGIYTGSATDGRTSWASANAWAANLSFTNGANVYDNWRLPTVEPVNGSTFNYNSSYNGSTDYGYNVSEQGTAFAGSTGSEMAHLFYDTLNNKGYCPVSTNCSPAGQTGWGLTNKGPFSNLQANHYWSATEYAPPSTDFAWSFAMGDGWQFAGYKGYGYSALAVSPGDVAAVPEAETYALMLAGLGLVGWRARRRG